MIQWGTGAQKKKQPPEVIKGCNDLISWYATGDAGIIGISFNFIESAADTVINEFVLTFHFIYTEWNNAYSMWWWIYQNRYLNSFNVCNLTKWYSYT